MRLVKNKETGKQELKKRVKRHVIIMALVTIFFIHWYQDYKFQSDMYQFRLEMSEQQVKLSQTECKVIECLLQMSNFLQQLLKENGG